MKKIIAAFLAIILLSRVSAQKDDSIFIRQIANEILLNGKAYDNLRHLTKQIGGRLSGSPQMYKAEQWGLNLMQESGADKTWLQECMVPHWVRGGKDMAEANYNAATKGARNYIHGTKKLNVAALGNSNGTGSKGILADVIEVKSFDELERKKDSL